MTDPSEFAAFARGVLANLDGAGALADALQEAGREPEAVLLRRRWKMWRKRREMAMVESLMAAYPARKNDFWARAEEGRRQRACDSSFAHYIRSRFIPRKKPTPPAPHTCERPRTCSCSMWGLEPSPDCPIHSGGGHPPKCQTCGRMMPWTREPVA